MERKNIIPGSREDRKNWDAEEADRRRYTPRILPPEPDAILAYYLKRNRERTTACEMLAEKMQAPEGLRMAIQKNGRLSELSLKLLETAMTAAHIPFAREVREEWQKSRKMVFSLGGRPNIRLISARQSDIPWYIESGNADYGVVGEDQLVEKEPLVKVLARLGQGEISLVIAVPNESKIRKMKDLSEKVIATSFPNTLKKELGKRNIAPKKITVLGGSVEAGAVIGFADAICDLTETGETLKENGLRELETIRDYEALLIGKAAGTQGL